MSPITSSQIVEITLGILIAFSVLTWSIILFKAWELWRLNRANRAYGRAFWEASNLEVAAQMDDARASLARLAKTGFDVLREDYSGESRNLEFCGDRGDILERSLRQRIQQERQLLEQGLIVLASVGSTAPFIGLFGTVWGIMHALQDISKAGSASLDVVAGPIGEALVATAIGIATAIPAVLAYNFLLRRVKVCEAELENFATDFLHLALKAGLALKRGR